MNDRGIKDEMFFRIFQVYFYLIPPQVNGNKHLSSTYKCNFLGADNKQ